MNKIEFSMDKVKLTYHILEKPLKTYYVFLEYQL